MRLIWVHSGVDCKVMRPPCLHPPPLSLCVDSRDVKSETGFTFSQSQSSVCTHVWLHSQAATYRWSQPAHIQKPSVIWAHINIHIKYLQVNWLAPCFRCIDYYCVTVSYLYGNCLPSGLPHCQWWTSMASLSLTKTMSSELLQTDTGPNKATLWSSWSCWLKVV